MAAGPSVHIPSPSPHHACHPEAPGGEGGNSPPGPSLAQAFLVRRSSQFVRGQSVADPSKQDPPQSGGASSSGTPVASSNRLVVERHLLKGDCLPDRVILMIQASCRDSTNRIYDTTWRVFCSWCTARRFQPLEASVTRVLESLQDGLDKGLAANMLCRQWRPCLPS